MSKENNYLNNQYQSFFENSLSKIDPDIHKAISDELANDRVRVERGAAPSTMLITRQIALGNARIKEWQVRADLAKTIYQLHLAEGTLASRLGLNLN